MPVPIISPRSMSRTPAMPSSSTRQASTSALSWKRSAIRSSICALVSGVLIEALSGLGAEVAGLELLLHAAVHVEAVAVGLAHVAGDLHDGVQARHVGDPERPHRHLGLLADELVELLDVDPRLVLVAPDLARGGDEDAVDHEAGTLVAADGHLLDRLGEVGGGLGGLRRGVLALDHLDQPHVRRRPEKVEADHLVGTIGGVADLRDRQARGVGGEDRVAGRRGIQIREHGVLDLHLLRHGLDDEVDVAELGVVGRTGDQLQRAVRLGGRILLRELPLLHQLRDLALSDLARLFQSRVDELGVDVLEHHRDPRRRDDLGDLAAHHPRADDSCFEHEHAAHPSRAAVVPDAPVSVASPRMRIGLTVMVLTLLFAAPARATVIHVDAFVDPVDPGTCSLRDAIATANGDALVDTCEVGSGDDVIQLAAGAYGVSNGAPGDDNNITGDLDVLAGHGALTIAGAGAGSTTISAAGDRVLDVIGGTVTLSGVTLTGSAPPGD